MIYPFNISDESFDQIRTSGSGYKFGWGGGNTLSDGNGINDDYDHFDLSGDGIGIGELGDLKGDGVSL